MTELDALAVSRQLGVIEATLANLQLELREHKAIVNERFDKQGIRTGELEKIVAAHLQSRNSNGGWRPKVIYGGTGTGAGLILMKMLELIFNSSGG